MPQFQKAELIISAPNSDSWPDSELPEIVLAGRSNVGKSSFINTLTGRKKLAYVGNTPGKTRLLNFFCLDDQFMFVDVPGYGYAKLSQKQLIAFGEMMEEYFMERSQKKGLVMLVDARHQPTEDDIGMLEYARYYDIPYAIIVTKIDKLKRSQIERQVNLIRQTLALSKQDDLFLFSAVTKDGAEEIWQHIKKMFLA